MVDDKVNLDKHIQQQVNKANSIMGLIRRTYTLLDENVQNRNIKLMPSLRNMDYTN